ncbi:hypothetical protein Misp01_49710 [Microtetraspora sp. NBRC 13810]|uniref:MinD/ParA family ATP-binding protein n=1 Tax=Microtetraspora sp. NBRC 13810 TaxID=3030990 RepID=UPI0024A1CC54|nr:MinD/ParA family protein [Microtetraspora sp. NBRC 13810]GLW09842.1 hypothetical protein Misp01_49710 [Microtetraspora sp. NBRC 13810]
MARHDREDPHSLEEQLAWLDAIKETEEAPIGAASTALDETVVSPYPKDPWRSVPAEPEPAPPLFRAAVDSVYGAGLPEQAPADPEAADAAGWREASGPTGVFSVPSFAPPAAPGGDNEAFLAPLKPLPAQDEGDTSGYRLGTFTFSEPNQGSFDEPGTGSLNEQGTGSFSESDQGSASDRGLFELPADQATTADRGPTEADPPAATQSGTTPSGATHSGATHSGATRSGATRSGATRSGTADAPASAPASSGTASSGTVSPGTASYGVPDQPATAPSSFGGPSSGSTGVFGAPEGSSGAEGSPGSEQPSQGDPGGASRGAFGAGDYGTDREAVSEETPSEGSSGAGSQREDRAKGESGLRGDSGPDGQSGPGGDSGFSGDGFGDSGFGGDGGFSGDGFGGERAAFAGGAGQDATREDLGHELLAALRSPADPHHADPQSHADPQEHAYGTEAQTYGGGEGRPYGDAEGRGYGGGEERGHVEQWAYGDVRGRGDEEAASTGEHAATQAGPAAASEPTVEKAKPATFHWEPAPELAAHDWTRPESAQGTVPGGLGLSPRPADSDPATRAAQSAQSGQGRRGDGSTAHGDAAGGTGAGAEQGRRATHENRTAGTATTGASNTRPDAASTGPAARGGPTSGSGAPGGAVSGSGAQGGPTSGSGAHGGAASGAGGGAVPGEEPYQARRRQPAFSAAARQHAPVKPPVGGTPTADSLDPDSLLRGRRGGPSRGWRRLVYRASAGLIQPGESPEVRRRRELISRARTPVSTGHHRVAVLSLKGGVGKTTTTVGLGAMLAQVRGDRVIAVDANPDRGTLSDKVELETAATVRDLLNERGQIKRYVDVRAFTSQGPSRLEILASDRDPSVSEAFSATDYQAVSQVLENFYSICITDCGTGLLHSAMSGVLGLADQLVLVSSPSVDGARAASATLDWLEAHHYGELVRAATVVLCSVRPRSKSAVDLDRLEAHFAARCRAVIRVPYDPHLEEGAEIDLERLQAATRDSYLKLAASVGDGFAALQTV